MKRMLLELKDNISLVLSALITINSDGQQQFYGLNESCFTAVNYHVVGIEMQISTETWGSPMWTVTLSGVSIESPITEIVVFVACYEFFSHDVVNSANNFEPINKGQGTVIFIFKFMGNIHLFSSSSFSFTPCLL